MPSVTFYTGAGQNAFTTATRVAGPTVEYPIKRNLTVVFWRETWWQTSADYTPLALDSAHGTISGAYLVSEEGHAQVGGGVISWDRVYAKIPTTWDDFGTLSYQFPGYKFNDGSAFLDRGDPRSLSVTVRIRKEYFLCASGQTYTTPASIPIVERQRYILTYGTQGDSDVDYVLFFSGTGFETSPTAEEYQGWIFVEQEIIAEDSYIEPLAGNIWCRVTKYVAAR